MSQLNDDAKQALRLAAVGALLHNLGKINAKFLDKQINRASNDYLYQHILALIAPYVDRLPSDWQSDFDVNKLTASDILDSATVTALKTGFHLPSPLDDRADYTVGDLIEYLGQGERWYEENDGKYRIEHIFSTGSRLTHLMNRAHRGASGGEKEDIATAQQPYAGDLYLSTPFGYETVAPNINNIDNLLNEIETKIQEYFPLSGDSFPLLEIVDDLRLLLSRAAADTRRPLNDVTVGDIGHTGMAFLLTQAVEWIITKRSINHTELAKRGEDNTLFWRVLTVHVDALRYLEEASSIADLRVRQERLKEAFQAVSFQLERTLFAVKIYGDEQCRLFLLPNLDQDTSAYQSIQQIIDTISIDGLRLTAHLSGSVTNHPDDNNKTYIGDQVTNQLQELPAYNFDAEAITKFWQPPTSNKEICTACNLRPQGYGAERIEAYKRNLTYYQNKAIERNICCICMDQRAGVAKTWAKDKLDKTVWLDEVADGNGRLALIVGHWNLENFIQSHFYPHANHAQAQTIWRHTVKFLNNTPSDKHTFTINGQPYIWQGSQFIICGEQELSPLKQPCLIVHAPSSMDVTVQDVNITDDKLSLTVAEDLTEQFPVNSRVKCLGQDFQIVEANVFEAIDERGKQKVLETVLWDATYPFIVQQATRVNIGEGAKNKSFARLRRIWQTTQTFWKTALGEKDANGDPLLLPTDHRLEIIPQNRGDLKLNYYQAYDLKLTDSVKLSVVWDPDNQRFITCDNLEYLAKPELLDKPVAECLKGELDLEEPTGYGSKNKVWGKITIEQVCPIANSSYIPAIPILAEPRTFMALVPADKALDILQAVQTKYAREMGKVRNRLPLHMGVVYFQRRTPLRAALDAGRRMLRYEAPQALDQTWVVKGVQSGLLPDDQQLLAEETQQFSTTIAVELEQAGRSFTWYVPAKMGDGQTDDHWYPYVFTRSNVDGRQRIFKALRPTANGTNEECRLVHAAELVSGDEIYFTPATFDFEWLDTSARRFEIAYDESGVRYDRTSRPYLLDELSDIQKAWTFLSEGLTSSQIYALRDTIETRREAWQAAPDNPAFKQLCSDTIRNAQWKSLPDANEIEKLTGWAVSGLLADSIELYMGIMKQKPQLDSVRTGEGTV
ncbi:MAG: hypothetical protein KDD92_19835 [Caldilineaceae bacterium]|nr:hypothetical protein [Caldilineaceae bacterium]